MRGPRPRVYDAIRAVAEGEAERALVPFENSIEGAVRSTLDTLAFEAPSVTIAGEHDHPISEQPDRPQRARPWSGSRWSSPIPRPAPSARASSASSCPARRCAPRPARPRRCARSPSAREPWAALGAASAARHLRLRGPSRGSRGRARQRHPLRLDRAGRDQARGWRALAHDARLLRARRRPPRRPGRGADRVLQPRGEPDPDRVAAAAARARPLHVLHRPRRGRGRARGRRGDRGAARQGRVGANPGQLSGRGQRDPGT